MRTSRISKETAKLLGETPLPPTTSQRVTRSLARFAYQAANSTSGPLEQPSLLDIEDSVGPRKRRRTAKTEQIAASLSSSAHKQQNETRTPSPAPAPTPRKRRKPARVVRGPSPSSAAKVEPPSDWEEMYALIREMRLSGPARDAPVDTMGCDRLFDPAASDRDKRFHILIALMLSSQTKDTVNAAAMGRLHNELPPHAPGSRPGLTLENVLAVEPSKLNELIRVVGFHNNKTKYIKQAAELIRDKHNSDIPTTIEGLTSLPGVGPKMAHLCLSAAWDRTEGIGVDVHVHRLTNLWGWHPRPTSNPEATRLALESWLPRDRWREINTLLVGLGQTVCPPQAGSRRCGECSLGLQGLCRAADRKKVAEGRKAKVEVKTEAAAALKVESYEEDGVVTGAVAEETAVTQEVKKEEEE